MSLHSYHPVRAELKVGAIGKSKPLVKWIDPEYNSLDDAAYIAFEAEKGSDVSFAGDC